MRALAFCLMLVPAMAAADRVTVFAAASVAPALDPLAASYGAASGDEIVLSYAGTSLLARQIIEGAPADLFLAASSDWMDEVEAAGRLEPGSRVDLLGNALVVVGPAGAAPLAPADLPQALGDGRLAVALTDSVPAGQYARAALTSLGLWDGLSGRLAEADNVRAALTLVVQGAAPFGIVYATDAVSEPAVAVLATFPGGSHPPIVYPAALVAGASPAAAAFLDWLEGPEAAAGFAEAGFLPPPG